MKRDYLKHLGFITSVALLTANTKTMSIICTCGKASGPMCNGADGCPHNGPFENWNKSLAKQEQANATPNTQLPAEVSRTIEQQAHDATCALFSPNNYNEFTSYQSGYIKGATEYATKLHQVEQEREFYKTKLISEKEFFEDGYKDLQARHTAARALLSKFIDRHEAGLLPDRGIYEEIKNFLDGK